MCAAMPIRVARAAARRYSSHAPLAPRFATTLNYTTSDMIQLAQSDEAAAVRGFWQPLRDYRSLMRSLSERHAREELGLDGEAALAAAIRVESADQRRTRLASFGSFMAALTSSGDEEAAAAAAAGRLAGKDEEDEEKGPDVVAALELRHTLSDQGSALHRAATR